MVVRVVAWLCAWCVVVRVVVLEVMSENMRECVREGVRLVVRVVCVLYLTLESVRRILTLWLVGSILNNAHVLFCSN